MTNFLPYYDRFASFEALAYDSTDGDMDVFVLGADTDAPLGASVAWEAGWSPLFLNLALVGETTLVANEHLGIRIDLSEDVTFATPTANGWNEDSPADSYFGSSVGIFDVLHVVDVMNPTHFTVAGFASMKWADGWNIQIPYSYTWDQHNPPVFGRYGGDGTSGNVPGVVVRIMDAPSADITISASFGWRVYPVAFA